MADSTDAKAGEGAVGTPDAAAVSLALGSVSREKADAYIDEQTKVARAQEHVLRLQAEDLRREDKLRHWSLRVHHISDVMKLTFQFAGALVVLAVAVFIGAAVWSAASDNSLVIEAFSVPPDMAARGLTGQAVAAQLQDKLGAMQDATDSARPANSYANNWGDDIKVQIPDTGVSIGQFYQILTSWLGHQTHITGEVYRNAKGITITARAGGDGGATVAGAESDIDDPLQRSAEAIYERTQPYRYAIYAEFHGRDVAAHAILQRLSVAGDSPRERAWAYVGLGVLEGEDGDGYGAAEDQRKAAALVPDFALAYTNIDGYEGALGHDEAGLAAAQHAMQLLQSSGDVDMTSRARTISLPAEKADVNFYQNDFSRSLQDSKQAAGLPDYSGIAEASREAMPVDLALIHEPSTARRAWRDLPSATDAGTVAGRALTQLLLGYWLGDWSSVLSGHQLVREAFAEAQKQRVFIQFIYPVVEPRQIRPYVAYATAATGDVRGARTLIATTPLDCFVCLRMRADIEALEKNWTGSNYWFARAAAFAPSIPLGYSDWGKMLLAKGDLDGAIAKFTLANQKGPHFADPLEMWGEALMLKNRSDLALAKFQQADLYAPNWGRLHLKWGEALVYAGQRDEAQKQFAVATGLDLLPSEKSELARMRAQNG